MGVVALAVFGGWQLASGAWVHAKAELAQHLLESAWEQTQAMGGAAAVRPWPWADTWPVARLHFPRLGASFIVLAGDSGSSLAFGPGHNGATAPPGRPGTSVISGHRDTHFSGLGRLRVGDCVEVERPDGIRVVYRIAALEVADTRRDRLAAGAVPGALPPSLALVTCWPFDAIQPGGPLRYVVSAYAAGAAPAAPAAFDVEGSADPPIPQPQNPRSPLQLSSARASPAPSEFSKMTTCRSLNLRSPPDAKS